MASLLPSIQKRLLRYALSRLEVLDTDALDLEHLDITWGATSTLEFRNIGLQLQKLQSLLQLPPTLSLAKANVPSLRITIPVDIYRSPIVVDIDGVEGQLRISPEKRTNHDRNRKEDEAIPTAADLAASFLETEPAAEKARLEKELQTEDLYASQSDDGEDDAVGTGAGLSLPAFMTNFLQGIVDRLEVRIRNIFLDVDVRVPADTNTEAVTFRLKIDDIEVEGLTRLLETAGDEQTLKKEGRRLILLRRIRGTLISEAHVFAALARSGVSSPTTTHSLLDLKRSPAQREMAEVAPELPQPETPASEPPSSPSEQKSIASPIASPIASSIVESDSGRFDDASDDGDSHTQGRDPANSVFEGSEYMDHLTDSQIMAADDDFTNSPPMFARDRQRSRSPLATPRASMIIGSSPTASLNARFRHERSEGMLHSTTLPHRPGALTEVSRSQPLTAGYITGSQPQDGRPPAFVALGHDDPSPNSSDDDDLAQSRLFSHEEAESMYMSAMSRASEPESPLSISRPSGQEGNISPPVEDLMEQSIYQSRELSEPGAESQVPGSFEETGSGATTPREASERASSPSGPSPPATPMQRATTELSEQSATSQEDGRLAKQILDLDQICIYLPGTPADPIPAPESDIPDSVYPGMPGAFSMHIPKESEAPPTKSPVPAPNPENAIEVILGRLYTRFDISIGRLLFSLVTSIMDALKSPPVAKAKDEPSDLKVKLRADHLSLKFLDSVTGNMVSADPSASFEDWTKPTANVLLRTTLKGLVVDHEVTPSLTKTMVTLHKFVFGYAKENIISFDADLRMRSSIRDLSAAAGVDLTVLILQSPTASRIKIDTLPLHVSIDLQKLDETFSWFGGLSGVLNMGSSMASTSTMTGSPSKPKPRGVRFETPITPEDTSISSQNKLDARIGGFVLDLVGKQCTVGVDTTAVKAVSRDEGVGIAIDKIKLSGPHIKNSIREPAITAEINGTRVEYLGTPKDVDLDRLLSLITPSKAKYDNDDDILLDTLLRQRRQGAVVRVTVDDFKTRVSELDELSYLPELGEEIGRLSTVAKYLPEDDRPGLLALVLLRNAEVHVDINNVIGSLQLHAKDVEVAEITMPALTALSIGGLDVYRNGAEEVIARAIDTGTQSTPCLMARMIGDEMEPVVKIKCYNLRAEYRVTTLMALLSLSEERASEEMAASMVASVANLTGHMRSKRPPSKSKPTKTLAIDVSLHDCILGLNPLNLPSKVLVVFTDAHLGVVLPHDNQTSATGSLHKASLLVIDDVENIEKIPLRPKRQSFDGGSRQVADLCSMGFVSVSYISSAQAIVHIQDSIRPEDKSIEIELRDDLLVLETCADSTQTLIAALNGLAPPAKPSKETRYRTEVIPVEDLLASLSGEAFGTAEGEYDFDVDFGGDLGSEADSINEEPRDLLIDSKYYAGGDDIYNADDFFGGSSGQASMMSEVTTKDTKDGVLLESFVGDEPSSPLDELDFQEDHFGTGSILEGTAHRWNSAKNTYDRGNDVKIKKSPLKVCVRDVHVIWNLFDGYDWPRTRDVISKAVHDVESRAIEKRARHDVRSTFEQDVDDGETVIGDFLFNSIYIGIPSNRDPRELALAINQELNDNATETESIATTTVSTPSRPSSSHRVKGKKLRLNRSKHHKITFELRGINMDMVSFPPGSGETQSSIDVRVRDFEIFDHVPTSTWKKFATYMHDAGERESGASQVHIELLNVKPLPELAAAEIVLKVTILPLRLHVDQDALDFITRFFEFKDRSAPSESSGGDAPFLQRVEVNAIPVKLDFKPKRVDYAGLRSGHTTEFMNFIVLDEADMVLRHTIIYGIKGFDRMGKTLNDIWMPDVKRNQLPGILAGLAPVRSLVNVGGGVRDLVVVPMREYKKDGRIVRSIAKGAAAFANTTGTELVKLGAKLAVGTQSAAKNAEDLLTQAGRGPQNSDDDGSGDEENANKQISFYSNQPIGFAHGLKTAYAGLGRDLATVKNAIIAISGEVMESSNAAGAAKAVARGAPTLVLTPVRAIAGGAGQVLMGAANTLDPKNRRRIDDKYKRNY